MTIHARINQNAYGELISSPSFVPVIGPELVALNKSFSEDRNWTKGDGWTISGKKGNCDGSQVANSDLQHQSAITSSGKYYLLTYTISNYSAGNVRLQATGVNGTWRGENGTFQEYLKPTGSIILFRADSDFVGSVDNVSVKEVTNALDYGSQGDGWAWDFENSKIDCDGSQGSTTNLLEQNGLNFDHDGKLFRCEFTLTNLTAGECWLRCFGTSGASRTANGTYIEYITGSTSDYSGLQANGAFIGTIDNISITQVMQENLDFEDPVVGGDVVTNGDFAADTDWSKQDGWTIAAGVANCDGTQGTYSNLSQSMGLTVGTVYKLVYTILNYVSGRVRAKVGSPDLDVTWREANGTYTEYHIVTGNAALYMQAEVGFEGDIDNVEVRALNFVPRGWTHYNTPALLTQRPDVASDQLAAYILANSNVDGMKTSGQPFATVGEHTYRVSYDVYPLVAGLEIASQIRYGADDGWINSVSSYPTIDQWNTISFEGTIPLDSGGAGSYVTIFNQNALPGELFGNIDFAPEFNELITNGDFPTDLTGWTDEGGYGDGSISVVAGKLHIDQGATSEGMRIGTEITTEVGKSYVLTLGSVANTGTAKLRVWIGTPAIYYSIYDSVWQSGAALTGLEIHFVATETTIKITLQDNQLANETSDWDDISCKENAAASGDMKDDLGSDLVASGDFEEVLGSDEISSGDFDEVLAASILNSGDFEPVLGSDLITNGDFVTDSNWVKTDTTIADGVAHVNTAGQIWALYQSSVATTGKTYKITYDVLNYSSGGVKPRIGNTNGALVSANGTYVAFILADGVNAHLIFGTEGPGFVADIDNVIMEEVTNADDYIAINGPLTFGFSEAEQHGGSTSIKFTTDTEYNGCRQEGISLTNGEWYKASFWVLADVPTVQMQMGDGAGTGWHYNGSKPVTIDTWTLIEFYFQEDVGGSAAKMGILSTLSEPNATIHIDDFSLQHITNAADWSTGDATNLYWDFANGVFHATGGQGAAVLATAVGTLGVAANVYKMTYTIANYVAGQHRLKFSANWETGNGSFTEYITGANATFGVYGDTNFEGDITLLSVEEVTNADEWTPQTGWTLDWANGEADCDGSQTGNSSVFQWNAGLTVGKTYRTSVTISAYTAGQVQVRLGGAYGAALTANGTYIEYITVTDSQNIYLYADVDFDGKADDFTVEEVTNVLDWTLGDGCVWDFANEVLHWDASQMATSLATQASVLTLGHAYKVTFTVANRVGGAVQVRCGSNGTTWRPGNGTYTEYLTCVDSTTVAIAADSAYEGDVTGVMIEPLLESWTYGSVWEHDAINELSFIDGSQPSTASIYQSITETLDRYYRIRFTVSNRTAGNIKWMLNGTQTGDWIAANGTYEFVIKNTQSTAARNAGLQADSSFIGAVDDIQIEEVNPFYVDNVQIEETYQPVHDVQRYGKSFGDDLVDNGDFEALGADVVTNGDFAADSDWYKGDGWTIPTPVASCDGTQVADTFIRQNDILTEDLYYKLTFTVTAISAGQVRIYAGALGMGTWRSEPGTYSEYIMCDGNDELYVLGDEFFVGSVDDVIVEPVDVSDWTLGGAWTITDGVARCDGLSNNSIWQATGATVDLTYAVTFRISNYVSGQVRPILGLTYGDFESGDGVYTQNIVRGASNDRVYIEASSFEGDIDDVSVRLVSAGSDWREDIQRVYVKAASAWKKVWDRPQLPEGIILPFNGASVPAGWEAYTAADGKHIVGAGTTYAVDDNGAGTGGKILTVPACANHTGALGDAAEGNGGGGQAAAGAHGHTMENLAYVTPAREQLLIKALRPHLLIPKDGILMSGTLDMSATLTEIWTDGQLLKANNAVASVGTNNPASINTDSQGEHDHAEQEGGAIGGIIPKPTLDLAGGHIHAVDLTMTPNFKRFQASIWSNAVAAFPTNSYMLAVGK